MVCAPFLLLIHGLCAFCRPLLTPVSTAPSFATFSVHGLHFTVSAPSILEILEPGAETRTLRPDSREISDVRDSRDSFSQKTPFATTPFSARMGSGQVWEKIIDFSYRRRERAGREVVPCVALAGYNFGFQRMGCESHDHGRCMSYMQCGDACSFPPAIPAAAGRHASAKLGPGKWWRKPKAAPFLGDPLFYKAPARHWQPPKCKLAPSKI